MTLNYYLLPNRFDSEARDYTTKVRRARVYDLDAFITEMVRYHSTHTEADFHGSFKVEMATAIRLVQDGCHINTPLYSIRPTLRGRVSVNGASLPPLVANATISPGPALRAAMNSVEIFRLPTFSAERSAPLFYVDDRTHEVNKIITIGGRGQLLGERMRFDPSDPNQGIYLIDRESGAALQVETGGSIDPARITVLAPAGLVAGKSYIFEVRNILDASGDLRIGRLVYDVVAQEPT